MTAYDLAHNFLTGSYALANVVVILLVMAVFVVLLRKPILAALLSKLNVATKNDLALVRDEITKLSVATRDDITKVRDEITKLSVATKDDITKVRDDFTRDLTEIRENDLFHTNKAILLLARGLLQDTKPDLYSHIEDTLLETTPQPLRDQLLR